MALLKQNFQDITSLLFATSTNTGGLRHGATRMFGIKPAWIIEIVLVFIVSACGTQATPAIDPGQVQASAAAMASTMVAVTNVTLHARHPALIILFSKIGSVFHNKQLLRCLLL
jgi:hypothetical protein